MSRSLIVHIGQHKTASTSIQAFAVAMRGQLEADGICYPVAGTFDHYPAHHSIAWEARGDTRYDPNAGGLADALAEIVRSGCPTGLLSSEDFAWLAGRRDLLRAFHSRLVSQGFRVRYVAFHRRVESAVPSLYAELLKHGLSCSYDFFAGVCNRERCFVTHGDWRFELDPRRLVQSWRTATGATLEVFSYDDAATGRGVLPAFWQIVGASEDIQATSATAPRMNVSPHRPAA